MNSIRVPKAAELIEAGDGDAAKTLGRRHSRAIHCSSTGIGQPSTEAKLMRAISLVCMMPKHLTPFSVIEERKDAVKNVISTTNWTDQLVNADHFPPILAEPNPGRFKRPEPPELSEAQRQLVGY